MRKCLRFSFLLLLTGFVIQATKAQVDPHFSQYYVYPAWLNPALTGAFDGDYRLSGIYRTQWGNISSPFSTPGFSAEFTTDKNVNWGVSVLNQTAGNGGYNYTTAYGNFAYTGARFGANQTKRLTFGLQAGLIQRRFDRSKLTFGDQWNPITGYSSSNPTADVFIRNNSAVLDIGAGVMFFDAQPGQKANVFAGFSVSHLTQPEDKFSASGDEKFPMRYTAHGGLRIGLSDRFSITPNFLYLKQGSAQEKMAGAYGQYKATPELDLMLGANYRFEDAISPFFGFAYKNLVLGASYDINTSDLGKMVNGSNSFEISLSFIGRKTAKTPEVEFVCPRL
ncbi:MAG TPA: PorP/SprF family type IX secretion system membrane protein [Chitinophagaceae bacterium]|nr:PorP/SprF family type IX secretion system membrane protein [Chitinophagaceae bacterium]